MVAAISGTAARVRDSRKTLPGLRALEKYAVRCGGGVNHRMSLSDAALIKDNHVVAAGGVAEAFRAVRERYPDLPIEVEVDSDRPDRAGAGGGRRARSCWTTSPWQRLARGRANGGTKARRLGVQRGVDLGTARDVAETGVDYLAVGALTHSAPALDIALDLRG